MSEEKKPAEDPKKAADAAKQQPSAPAVGPKKTEEMRPDLGQKTVEKSGAPAPAAPAQAKNVEKKEAPTTASVKSGPTADGKSEDSPIKPPETKAAPVAPKKAEVKAASADPKTTEVKFAPTAEAKKPVAPAKPAESRAAPAEPKKVEDKPVPPAEAKKPDAPAKPSESKAVTAEPKKPEVKPTPAAEAKKPDTLKPSESKAAPTEPKKAEIKPAPTAEAKKPDAPTKPAESKAAPVEPKKPDVKPAPAAEVKKPETPAKASEVKSEPGNEKKPAPIPAETPKEPGIPVKPAAAADPQKTQGDQGKAGAAGLGLAITQIFADRLDYPDEKAMKSLPVPKENEGFSMRLHPAYFREFLDHPFSINRDVKDYKDLFESIRENGISEPVLARPGKDGGLELISGHRRHDIARQLNYPVPVVIRQIDDDTAQIAVVDGNLHRQDIPTSELARAAKMKMDALARKAGRRSKMEQLTAPQKRTDEIVGQDMGISRNQVQRLVRIDALVPELKQQVDEKKLPFNTAVELSYLKPEEQAQVVDVMKREQVTPSMAQATQLKEASRNAATMAKITPSLAASHKVDEKKVSQIIKPKADPPLKVTLSEAELRAYFPTPLPSVPEIKHGIFEALSMRNKALAKQAGKDAAKKAIKAVR